MAGSWPALLIAHAAVATASAPAPFGHPCVPFASVRMCATQGLRDRVPSFDGTPLDVDVTLPATGKGPFPTVLLLHGLGSSKGEDETSDPNGGNGLTDVWYSKHGYAAVVPDMRGFGTSCGTPDSRTADCARGWFHLADERYEARDMQYLLGLLVDEGIADPKALGSAGCSYGSVVTLELALLRNRIRLTNGAYAPWLSPKGTPLSLAAAYSQCSIASWLAALGPNGRFLDYANPTADLDRTPVGVVKASVVGGALALMDAKGFMAPPLIDSTADYATWSALAIGEPPDNAQLGTALDEISRYHQAMGIDIAHTTPAPLLVENGWADDYTPPQAGGLLLYRYLRSRNPHANIALQFADWGHQRSKQKAADGLAVHTQGTSFFDYYLRHVGKPPAPGSVTAYTQSCPMSARSEGPFTAPSWLALHPGEVRFGNRAERTITDQSADPSFDAQLDPAVATPCQAYPVSDDNGAVVYRHVVTTPFTVLGLPTIDLDVATTGQYARLIARLWDEAPDGTMTLVTRGVYRLTPNQRGHVTFQLFGGGWHFRTGHVARLEIAGADAPFFKAAEEPFTARISNIRIALPTHERPNGGEIQPLSHLPAERCATTITVRLRRAAKTVVVRSGGRTRTLHNVHRGRLTVAVSGRRATVEIYYGRGVTRRIRRALCVRV
jgi:fermentation-respiration switch protein FrsA (DUF1100 family)